MRNKALNEVRRLLICVLHEPRLESSQRQRLLKLQRELKKIGQSGKLDHDRLFRVTEGIAIVLLEVVARDERHVG